MARLKGGFKWEHLLWLIKRLIFRFTEESWKESLCSLLDSHSCSKRFLRSSAVGQFAGRLSGSVTAASCVFICCGVSKSRRFWVSHVHQWCFAKRLHEGQFPGHVHVLLLLSLCFSSFGPVQEQQAASCFLILVQFKHAVVQVSFSSPLIRSALVIAILLCSHGNNCQHLKGLTFKGHRHSYVLECVIWNFFCANQMNSWCLRCPEHPCHSSGVKLLACVCSHISRW